MRWQEQSSSFRLYLLGINIAAVPFAFLCFKAGGEFSFQWLLFTVISLFVATINIRLPKLSAVISMGDVFIILVLMEFGAAPALITYWIDTAVAIVADLFRRHGLHIKGKTHVHRWVFNLSCCAISTWAMFWCYQTVALLSLPYPAGLLTSLVAVALGWFVVNTGTLSLALAFEANRSFLSVWREGIVLYLLNFLGSASAAGLISLFYARFGFLVFVLSVPVAVVLYQLYRFHIEKFDQAQNHIAELNKLYLQTVEALASAVDAKDRYTHGHIRRVQAYAEQLAKQCGISNENELMAIQAGALLHDIGKIAIPEYILNKPTALTETEYEKMKIHPVVGANMLSTIEFPYPLVPLVKSHHERWDGNGYPDGLKGDEIPLAARVLSLIDCYDALTTNRPYRQPMDREKVVEFFRREAGRAYDPFVVETFVTHIEEIEAAGKSIVVPRQDLWGTSEKKASLGSNERPLEKVQPVVTYGKALNAEPSIQRELFSVFEFARADFRCLTTEEIFSFMGRRLAHLVAFDTAVFYRADLSKSSVEAAHIVGEHPPIIEGMSLSLDQKLTGWVAANNQSLCNLPPFPDFLNCPEPRPNFQMSAIAPMNHQNEILGAISLYRNGTVKFTEAEFRRLEIVASQTALLLSKRNKAQDEDLLIDSETKLPNGFQLYLMFDRVAVDAMRYEYPLALLSITLDEMSDIRRKWGQLSAEEALRATANYLRTEVRETDLLVRYGSEEFTALNPRMSRELAENLKSRLQNALDHFKFIVRPNTEIPLRASIGIAVFPEDGTDLESLLAISTLRASEDHELRSAIKRQVRRVPMAN
jgi:diguanylate cyclase (GGDEF)-like protein/putative nucleotidyltransferase with HDIG domain